MVRKRNLLFLLLFLFACSNQEEFTVGVIIPLSGSASVWGEYMLPGMKLAQQDLKEEGVNIAIKVEDSQASPSTGVKAFHALHAQQVDAMISTFSSVSVPLATLADEKKIPLIATIASAKNLPDRSIFVFRMYSDEEQYVLPHLPFVEGERIAIIWRNDEFGKSVRSVIQREVEKQGKKVVADLPFAPGEQHFRSELTKMQSANPDTVFSITATPAEILSLAEQARGMNVQWFEASTSITEKDAREHATLLEGFRGIALESDIHPNEEFKKRIRETFQSDANFATALGYDIIKLLGKATKGKKQSGEEIVDALLTYKKYEGENGLLLIEPNGEINPNTYSVMIRNGTRIANASLTSYTLSK